MLVLSRKSSQRIRIGDSVTLTVVKIGGNVVRLGIEAPPEMPILREELLADSSGQPTPLAAYPRPASRVSRQEVFDKHPQGRYSPA